MSSRAHAPIYGSDLSVQDTTMRYKKLGRSGLLVSEICLGTMTFGGEGGGMWQAIGALQQRQVEQMYFSIGGRDIEREVAPLAQEENLAVLPWSPLAGGFFSGKYTRDGAGPNDARRLAFDFPPVDKAKGFDIIDEMKRIGDAQGASVAQIALAYLLHKPFVTSVIIGAKTREQLDANIAATNVKLSAADMEALDKVSALAPEYPGWMLQRQQEDRLGQVR